jgi:uracil-DNA glycosylase family 4
MALKREDMLRELELLPIWKQREQPQQGTQTSPMYEPAPKAQATPETMEPVAEYVAESAEAAQPQREKEPQVLADEMPPTEPASGPITSAEKDVPSALLSPMGPDRREVILNMDWQQLEQAVEHCPACNLHKTRTKTVFGVGDRKADWLFIGEAPGAEEDRRGEPFVGQAGKLLDNMLAAIKLKRGENVYILNVLKCRPPDNRDPQGEEVMQCSPYLERQVELIQPKLIVALGKFAAQSLLKSESTIASLRGKLHEYNGIPVVVTYHPAYLLRNMSDKGKAWEDLCLARETMQNL